MQKKIFHHGTIITMDTKQPIVESVLIEQGKIVAIGTNQEILALQEQDTIVEDLQNKTMLPGFIDSHSHIGQSMMFPLFPSPPVGIINSVQQLKDAVKQEITNNPPPNGEWFIGMGYDQSDFPDGQHPTRKDLDEISNAIPIVLMHASGHLGVVNSVALEHLGYTKDTPNPAGGVIGRFDNTNELNGILEESAILEPMMSGKIKMPSIESMIKKYVQAQHYYASFGITTAQDGGINHQSKEVIEYCRDHQLMILDVCAYVLIDDSDQFLHQQKSPVVSYVDHVKYGGAKFFLDGSPQGKTAWLTEPYYIPPEGQNETYRGYQTHPDSVVCDYFKRCIENNWQFLVHCNGDAAIDQFINMYKLAREETGLSPQLRPVMVHAQTIREDQLDQVKQLEILLTFFHDHVFYWGDYHRDSVLGEERAKHISPIHSAWKKGINFTMHQDTPVVPPNILFTIHNAVNRNTESGQVLGAEQRIPVEIALKAVTLNAAYQYFEEEIKGSITPGKYADFVILDKNPMEVPPEEIKSIKVLETIKQGKSIFKKD